MPASYQSSAHDEAAIREVRAVQTRALLSGDLDRAQRHWATDITIRRAMGQVVNGVDEARAVFTPQGESARRVAYRREPVDVQVSPDWPLAYEEGQWSGHLGGADGEQILAGRYAAQWVLRDGHWLIRSEVFVALGGYGPGRDFKAVP